MHHRLTAAIGLVVGIAADKLAFDWLNSNLPPMTCAPPQSLVMCVNFGATYEAHFNMALAIGLATGLLSLAAMRITAAVVRQRREDVANHSPSVRGTDS